MCSMTMHKDRTSHFQHCSVCLCVGTVWHARRGFLPGPPYEPILGPLTRLPVAWLLLQPSRAAARHQQPAAELAVPVQINLTLPDYLVPSEAFDKGMRIEWRPADRFRMYFGRRQFGTRSGAQCCAVVDLASCGRYRPFILSPDQEAAAASNNPRTGSVQLLMVV